MALEKILIVEDNDAMRTAIEAVLTADGFQVFSAAHGIEALEIMKDLLPDLILSDIAMPDMDGYQFFNAIRANSDWLAIPFIFLTARGEREDIFLGKHLGVEDYLVKPVGRQELVATVRARLTRSQELFFAELQSAYDDSLKMLATAIEQRDKYTRDHVERVMKYATTIARKMGCNENQISAVKYGSILHDIGKIFVREDLLRKPGFLDEGEWDEMKLHTTEGAELINNVPYLAPAVEVIRHHHERWDGEGYPDGLQGELIPLTARIVMVADALDAMTTSRTYREALTSSDAYHEIQSASGSQYDPAVVQAFMDSKDEIQNWMNSSMD